MNETFLKIFLLSMAPVGELNAGIPYGIFKGANPLLAYGAAIFGNMIPPAFLLLLLPGFEKLFGIGALPEIKTHHKLLGSGRSDSLHRNSRTFHRRMERIACGIPLRHPLSESAICYFYRSCFSGRYHNSYEHWSFYFI